MSRQRAGAAGIAAVLFLMLGGSHGMAQMGTSAQRPINNTDPSKPAGEANRADDPFTGRMADQLARSRNMDRQKRLVADTEKLLSLANELKQDVDKSDKNTLSVDVVKKAEEIEKLAHSVKEKMKGGA